MPRARGDKLSLIILLPMQNHSHPRRRTRTRLCGRRLLEVRSNQGERGLEPCWAGRMMIVKRCSGGMAAGVLLMSPLRSKCCQSFRSRYLAWQMKRANRRQVIVNCRLRLRFLPRAALLRLRHPYQGPRRRRRLQRRHRPRYFSRRRRANIFMPRLRTRPKFRRGEMKLCVCLHPRKASHWGRTMS